MDALSVLRSELQRWDTSWSIGSFGAIGEFHQDEGEELLVDSSNPLMRATARGAIRVAPHPEMQAVAYELLSPRPHRWSHGIALCLRDAEALGAQRTVLTELGPDTDAVRSCDRDDILFDIGLAQPQVDFCIRTREPELVRILRGCCGQPTFASAAGGAILTSHPHRVVISRLGRVEVYQKIGGPDTGGVSPSGPHTHVLPKLLAAKRTHSANTPIPEGLVPCAFLYPANPVMDEHGKDKPFDRRRFDRFQAYLDQYGLQSYVQTKKRAWQAIEAGLEPGSMAEPPTRLERTALRNALRQAARLFEATGDADRMQRIAAWRLRFDRLDDPEENDTA